MPRAFFRPEPSDADCFLLDQDYDTDELPNIKPESEEMDFDEEILRHQA